MKKKAVILLSGGMDSAVTLYIAKKQGYETHCLIFDYGQRHKKEIAFAKRLCEVTSSKRYVLKISMPWKASALLDRSIEIPKNGKRVGKEKIPPTYVPARNTIFISFALSFAEAIGSKAIYIGANAIDFSGYPDCRPVYFDRFNSLLKSATKEKGIRIVVPLLHKKKKDIAILGKRLGVDFKNTWSCYSGGKAPCMECDACRLREMGLK